MDRFATSVKVLVVGEGGGLCVVCDVGGFGEVHGGSGIGQVNDGGVRLMDWAVDIELRLVNICMEKCKSGLLIFQQSALEMLIDFILVNNRYRCRVKDVIPGEEVVNQHSFSYGCVVY